MLMPLPIEGRESTFQACCGKLICSGCIYAMVMEDIKKGKEELEEHLCAFCRTPESSSDEERTRRLEKLVENGNANAFYQLGNNYAQGMKGIQQDWARANEFYQKAGELGRAVGYYQLGCSYTIGQGVERDEKKAKYYCDLAAIKDARHNIGCFEGEAGNEHRAMKHFLLAANAGYPESLDIVKKGFMDRLVSKDEFEQTLRACHERQAEMKSDARDAAADFVLSIEH